MRDLHRFVFLLIFCPLTVPFCGALYSFLEWFFGRGLCVVFGSFGRLTIG